MIADLLRKSGRPVVLAVNKAEGLPPERTVAEFHELGLGDPVAISAAHGENVRAADRARARPRGAGGEDDDAGADRPTIRERPDTIKVAIVGRPNVGKSTLVNTILGEERVIAFDEPGTTRDAIYLDFERGGQKYTLIDTAGIRRRGKVFEAIEKFSVIKTLQAIEDAQRRRAAARRRARHHRAGRAPRRATSSTRAARSSSAINKWDAADADAREQAKRDLERKMGFLVVRRAPLHLGARRQGRRRRC